MLEVVDGAKRVSGVDFAVELVARRPGDPAAVWADNTRVREVLGWESHHALDEILESAWAWHSSHPDGYATARLTPPLRPPPKLRRPRRPMRVRG